jgi:hypothetical protein
MLVVHDFDTLQSWYHTPAGGMGGKALATRTQKGRFPPEDTALPK